ncbi:MAG: hypothetical protein AVDCRST_MAG29-2440, partial [uncultured Nocardioidaceae bacterium]
EQRGAALLRARLPCAGGRGPSLEQPPHPHCRASQDVAGLCRAPRVVGCLPLGAWLPARDRVGRRPDVL